MISKQVRAAEDAAADEGGDGGGRRMSVAERSGSGPVGSPGKTPQKSMPALRAELAHRLAVHYVTSYRCAGGHVMLVMLTVGCVSTRVCSDAESQQHAGSRLHHCNVL